MATQKPPDEATEKRHKIIASQGKTISGRLIASGLLVVVLFVLIIFVQKPQILTQHAATSSNCSPVPFYCLMLGGQKTCTRPTVCPTQPPPTGFVPQANKTPVTSNTSACTKLPSELTTKLVINFDFYSGGTGGYTIRAVDEPALNAFAAALKANPTVEVTINGYTDSVPFKPNSPPPVNSWQTLSVARAQAAENYLKSQGATANKYTIIGNGDANLIAPDDPVNGNELNRRDEITTSISGNSCSSGGNGNGNVTGTGPNPQAVCGATYNWSGYWIKKLPATAKQTSIATDWTTIPIKCTGNQYGISQWPGIEGTGGKGWLAQTGSYSECPTADDNHQMSYFAWSFLLGVDKVFTGIPTNKYPVQPGDQFSASMDMTSPGHITAVLFNKTRGWAYTRNMTNTTPGSLTDSESILEDEDSGKVPLPTFTSATFSNNVFAIGNTNVQPLIKAPNLTCVNLINHSNVQQDTVSSLTNNSFTVTFKHN